VRGARIQFERTECELASVTRELDWEIARANQLQRQQQKRLARTLHGPVQATVNAAAIKVDAAILAGTWTPEQAAIAQSDVVRALALLRNDDYRDTVDLVNVFARVQATWAGISDIEFHAPDDVLSAVAQDPTCAHVLADIVTEACANAAWHARAPHVSVTIDQPSSRRLVRVVVEDDGGTQPTLEAHEGMGTRILDEVAVEWARTSTTTGTLLIAVLPTAIGPTRDQNSEPLRSRHLRRP
jgi:two-component sensor histidine kinase